MVSKEKETYIGVFDSGFGGLHVLRGIINLLPQYNYLYLGDTARMPYGTRSQEVLYIFVTQAVDFLFKNNCELIIFACNTASSDALRKVQHVYVPERYSDKKVLGVLIPAVEEAVFKTKNKRIGVMATESTVKSHAFVREIKKLEPRAHVFQQACPLLVSFVEAGKHNHPAAELILGEYVQSLLKKNIDTLILGCTHYGILEQQIKRIVGEKIYIINETKTVPQKLKLYLEKHPNVEKKIGKKSITRFYSTDVTPHFKILGSRFFGKKIVVSKTDLI